MTERDKIVEGMARHLTAVDSGPEGSALFAVNWAEFGETNRDVASDALSSPPLVALLREVRIALADLVQYEDAIICYASSIDEHEPNRIVANARAAIDRLDAFLGDPK